MRTRIALTVALLAATPAPAQSPHHAADSLMSTYAAANGPGASLLVMRNGKVDYIKAYGLADVAKATPVATTTNFRLASLTKQFTATAVMLLEAEHKIGYDDDITSLLPALPAFARGVTVRHLLTHTGGLPEYEDFVPDSQTAQVHDRDIPSLIAHVTAAKFPPGTKYDYSNTGYGLLALIVERASGMRFADFLHDRIFVPLGMRGTVAFEDGRSIVRQRAFGHSINASSVRTTDQSNTSAVLGDGGIYASAADLALWDRAIDQHRLVRAAAQRQAWTPPTLQNGAATEYGFGWFVDQDRGTTRVRHHGESRGFTNGYVKYPEKRLSVVVLTNRTGGAPWDIAQRIADLYLYPSTIRRAASWRP